MNWAVLCDFDHTITTQDATDLLLELFALPQWQHIEMLWKEGHIGSRVCMQQQIALLRASPEQIRGAIDEIALDSHFHTFALRCQAYGLPLYILSDGLDYVINHILNRHGIPHHSVIAGHMAHKGENRWELTSPYAEEACLSAASTCKCAMARQFRQITGVDDILYIGDGRSDFCVSMHEADYIIAKSSLLTYCQQHQLPHEAFTDFAQALSIMETLINQHVSTNGLTENTLCRMP